MNARSLVISFFVVGALAGVAGVAGAQDRAACEQLYSPDVGQSGKDVIWVPTPDDLVTRMLQMAKVTPQDYVVDLGAGDGKIAIAAAKQFKARARGIEYNAEMVKLAQCYAEAEGVADRATVVQGDIFEEDFSKATVVTMYLLPDLNLRLRPTILAMTPGTRVVSHAFDMAEWKPDETATVDGRSAFLWIVPAPVSGTWQLNDGGAQPRTLRLAQDFQEVRGEAAIAGGAGRPLTGVSLRADQLRFSYTDRSGRVHRFAGTVKGDTIDGTVTVRGSRRAATATRGADTPTNEAPANEIPASETPASETP